MPYYRGDGDGNYYRGDPFLPVLALGARALLGGVARRAAQWVGRQTVGGAIAKTVGAVGTGIVSTAVVGQLSRGSGVSIDLPALLPGGAPLVRSGDVGRWPTDKKGNPRRQRKDGRPWKRPTLNPLNPRALKRALRRAEGFSMFSKRVMNALTKPGRVKVFKKSFPTRSA